MKHGKIIETIGIYVLVGAASTAGAALWTKVLEGKMTNLASRIKQPKSEKVIDFKQAKKRMGR